MMPFTMLQFKTITYATESLGDVVALLAYS